LTISSKLVDINGLEFAVSEETDTIDVGGFSDIISAVGAETAKFSGGGTMQANTGLRIGTTQLKIESGDGEPVRSRSIIQNTGWGSPTNMIDDNFTTNSSTSINGQLVVIDFTSGNTATLKVTHGANTGNSTIKVEISDDDISYTDLGNFNTTSTTGETVDLGVQTWRFVRITRVFATSGTLVFQVFEVVTAATVTARVRSSATLDTADGTVLITDKVLSANSTFTFDTDLLLTGNAEFITLEFVSFVNFAIPINLSEITSIKEV